MTDGIFGIDPRVARPLLIGSVALNVFLGGVLAVQMMREVAGKTPIKAYLWDKAPGWVGPADAALLRSSLAAHDQEIDRAQMQLAGALADAREALRQDPVDPRAVQTSVARVVERRQALEALISRVMTDAMLKMSRDGRERIATEIHPLPGSSPAVTEIKVETR